MLSTEAEQLSKSLFLNNVPTDSDGRVKTHILNTHAR